MKRHPVVSIDLIIQNPQGQILLGEVSEKWQDGGRYLWGLPGREVSFGEDLMTCVKRNLKQEVGMESASAKIVSINSNFGYGNHYVAIGVLVTANGSPRINRPEDWVQLKWFDKKDIPTKLFPSAQLTLKSFLEGVISLEFK